MRVRFHPSALEEFEEATAYYRERALSLGRRFGTNIKSIVQSIRSSPTLGTPCGDGIRKRLSSEFPYLIYYVEMDGYVEIFAIMHSSRKPGYWVDRLE